MLDLRLALILVLALLAGALAYQSPPASAVAVGWLGDRLFLRASEGQAAADALSFYGDELTDSAGSGRSRWTHRAGAALTFPGLGSGDLTLTLRAQGWPEDVLGTRARQPEVTVEADGRVLSRFTPTPAWADYTFRIPAELRAGPDLTVTLRVSDAFTSTARYADPRPKGIRLERVSVYGAPAAGVAAPAPGPLAWLLLCGALWLLALVALSGRPTLGFVLATVLVAGVAVGLTAVRAWAAALLPWLAAGSGLLLAVAWRAAIVDLAARLVRRYARGSAINYGLVAAGASWLALVAAQASSSLQLPGLNAFWDTFPDSLIYGMLWTGLALLVIVRGKDGLPRLSNMIAGLLGHPRAAPALLALFLLVWLGYAAAVAAGMPYVGHADYADNAVVARNLVAGRGFVVDYVTQFYQLYDGVTRPQETWPLLQPLWIAPFFALLGPSDWAAKIPNLIFAAALALLIYTAGARLWDRRVGLTAAVFVLTSYLFFRLLIYATSDLAFVALSFGAIWALYRAVTNDGRRTTDDGGRTQGRRGGLRSLVVGRRSFVISGVLTGLMLLQKPGSGGLIALGMGLWLLRVQLAACSLQLGWGKSTIYHLHSALRPLLVWGVIALTILSPYLARNMALFGRPFYSTESMDAWVLEYTDWDAIYGVYTTEGGLSALGVPDATWVLRWGFDRTLAKIGRQVLAARDYLVPAWPGLPLGLGEVLTGREDKGRLLFEMGAWLSLLGAIGSIDGRRRLLGLLLAAFLPYALFLALYWHTNEERYWVALMPWLALLAAGALWRGYDRVAAIGDGRWAPLGLALVVTAATLTVRPSWPDIAEKVEVEPQLYAADLQAYAWLRANAEPGAVVMTRVPWQLNWHSGLPALMIPNTADREVFLRIARHYRARYLVYDSLQSPPRAARPMLESLIADPALGVELVYTSPVHAVTADGTYKELATEVYRLPEDYGGVAPVVGEGQGGRSPP
ncbi:MAG TPA: glycosyltransferase family 39 protein [Roseiflexaceae bacterium]|nr:glycosyltransferase family 39 protein [Roseiflexaceae bacterium]